MSDEANPPEAADLPKTPRPPRQVARAIKDDAPQAAVTLPPRRRKQPLDGAQQKRLPLPRNLDTANFEYRIVNDDPGRIEQLKEEDWDVETNQPEYFVGRGADNHARKARLMKKPKQYYDEDRAAKSEQFNAPLKQIRAGQRRAGEAARRASMSGEGGVIDAPSSSISASHSYKP